MDLAQSLITTLDAHTYMFSLSNIQENCKYIITITLIRVHILVLLFKLIPIFIFSILLLTYCIKTTFTTGENPDTRIFK